MSIIKVEREHSKFLSKGGLNIGCITKPDVPLLENEEMNCIPTLQKHVYDCEKKKLDDINDESSDAI